MVAPPAPQPSLNDLAMNGNYCQLSVIRLCVYVDKVVDLKMQKPLEFWVCCKSDANRLRDEMKLIVRACGPPQVCGAPL